MAEQLVPEEAVRAFEIRVVLWFDLDGNSWITAHLEHDDERPPLHEVRGVAEEGIDLLRAQYAEDP